MLGPEEDRKENERKFIEEGITVWQQKKALDTARHLEDQRQLRLMLKNYNPWGKPGNGAPIPGSIRKAKWISNQPNISDKPDSVLTMGRPGHGAPLRTSSGRTKTALTSDPNIRFQFTENSRRSVDNELRYRNTPEEKENYRKQLESIITQKANRQRETATVVTPVAATPRAIDRAKQCCWCPGPWGRRGPGGRPWRPPRLQGYNFLKSLGWSNETTLRRLPHNVTEQMFAISGGVELVPLLARHRASPRRPLPTTDITCMSKILNGPPKTAHSELAYNRELSSQISQRQQKIEEQRQADALSSEKHYETWKGLWGRPGHGAPKGCNLAKEKLDVILYELPARRVTPA